MIVFTICEARENDWEKTFVDKVIKIIDRCVLRYIYIYIWLDGSMSHLVKYFRSAGHACTLFSRELNYTHGQFQQTLGGLRHVHVLKNKTSFDY